VQVHRERACPLLKKRFGSGTAAFRGGMSLLLFDGFLHLLEKGVQGFHLLAIESLDIDSLYQRVPRRLGTAQNQPNIGLLILGAQVAQERQPEHRALFDGAS
jgi:hypothetical protein